MPEDPVLEHEFPPRRHGLVHAVIGGLLVLGMDRPGPPVAFVVGLGLTREPRPIELRTAHFARRAVGPDDVADRFGRRTKAVFAGVERTLNPLLVDGRGHHGQEQDQESRTRHVEGQVLLPEPRFAVESRGAGLRGLLGHRERRGRHAGVMHAGDREPHHTGGQQFLPHAVLTKRQPERRRGGRHGDENRKRDDRYAIGEIAGKPHRRHAGVVHGRNTGAHHGTARQHAARFGAAAAHPSEADPRHGDGDDERQDREADFVADRHRHLEGEHADEMHRPDPAAQRDRGGSHPRPAHRRGRAAHAPAQIQRRVGSENGDGDREGDEGRVVARGVH